MITGDSLAKIFADYHYAVRARYNEQLGLVSDAINGWIDGVLREPLPDDWREQFGAVLDKQAAQGRQVIPESVRELEEWIEGWATEYGILPRTEAGERVWTTSSDATLRNPVTSDEPKFMSLDTPLTLTPNVGFGSPQTGMGLLLPGPDALEFLRPLSPAEQEDLDRFLAFHEFEVRRKARQAADEAALEAKGLEILFGVFTAMWEPADWGMTGYQVYNEPREPMSYAGMLPFIPAGTKSIFRATNAGADIGRVVSEPLTSGRTLTPVADVARPTYTKGHAGQPVVDHIQARAAGGNATDPSNLDIKPWEWNARKGAYEGQLLKQRAAYIKAGLRPEQADELLAPEWRWLQQDVLARPMNPHVIDTIPFRESP